MNKSKLTAAICAVVMTATFCTACSNDSGTDSSADSTASSEVQDMNKITLNSENAKLTGRTYSDSEGTLWCAMSGSGAEFEYTGKKLDIMIEGDSVSTSGTADNQCRIGIYVDGERVVDDMLNEGVKLYTPIDSDTDKTYNVKIIKLSECAMSCMGISQVIPNDGEIKAIAENARKIEFIGDSITCGYGVDDEDETHSFKTSTEDVTKAYAYKTAQLLGADYSMFSISGWGIISGWTGDGTKKSDQVLPDYYTKTGFSYGDFGGTKPQDIDWDFSNYQPDVIVINLGTNDDSYCGSDSDKRQEYVDGYVAFLKTVRENNPNAHIICSLGIMGASLFDSILDAYLAYQSETGDQNISFFRFDQQNSAVDGLAADWHPTESTHEKAAAALAEEIKTVMNWE